MKKIILLLFVSFFADTALAAVDYINVCDELNIPFSDDRRDCYNSVQGAEYVEDGAVALCAAISFSEDKVSCIVASLNKTYTDSELRACSREHFSDDRVLCMQERGQVYRVPQTNNRDLKRQLRRVKRLINEGKYFRAILVLDRILSDLD